jgi:hypothetical protein
MLAIEQKDLRHIGKLLAQTDIDIYLYPGTPKRAAVFRLNRVKEARILALAQNRENDVIMLNEYIDVLDHAIMTRRGA